MNRNTFRYYMFAAMMATMIALFAFIVIELCEDGLHWNTKAIIIISMSTACIIMCAVIFASVMLDRQNDIGSFCFMMLVFMQFLLNFSSLEHWYSTIMSLDDFWVEIIDYSNYLLFPGTIMAFSWYQMNILEFRWKGVRHIYNLMFVLFIAFCVMVAANYFTDVFPNITEDIADFRTLTPTRMIPYLAILCLCSISALLYAPTGKMKVIMLAYLLIPFATLLANYPDSAAFSCIAGVMMLFFIYGNTYLERGVTLAKNEAELSEQKVALLTSRIEPEFLIESLDSIMALEGTSPVARRAINLFKVYFRQNMDTINEKKPIPIKKELDHVKVYLSLEKLRFKEGLDVKFEITDTEFDIPAMAIQVLTENAVKHGITQREEGGTITIRTVEYEKTHRIQVIDDGVGFDVTAPRDTERSHIGIDNIVFRLKEMVDGTLEIKSTPGKGTIATIVIPKK